MNPHTAHVLGRLQRVVTSGDGWMAQCPVHEDTTASLKVSEGRDGRVLLKCFAGCDIKAIVEAIGLILSDLFPPHSSAPYPSALATYDYHDENGQLLFQVLRFPPHPDGTKNFKQRRPDGAGGWVWRVGDVRRVLYRLPRLKGKPAVFIVEGEKDADRLWGLGLPATTNPRGAGKWRPEYVDQLTAAGCQRVTILPDCDEPGEAHARLVARALHDAGLYVRLVPLPGLLPKGDVSDWLDAGHAKPELLTIVREAPPYNPNTQRVADPIGLELTSLTQLLEEPDEAVPWLVQDRIPAGSVILLAGKPKAGKSTLARDLAYTVASGYRWLGHPATQGPVWYLALEDKRSEVRRHFRLMGATADRPLPIRLFVGQAPADIIPKLQALAAHEKPALIVVDTLQRLICAKDMSDYAEVTTRFAPLLALSRETGAAVVVVHHAKKNGEGMDAILGSTALAGSVDNVLMLDRGPTHRSLSSIQRIGDDLEPSVVAMDPDTGRCSLAGSKRDVETNEAADKMLAVLVQQPEAVGERWLRDQVDAHPTDQARALRLLLRRGQVSRSGRGRRGDPYLYRAANLDTERVKISGSGDPEKRYIRQNQNMSCPVNGLGAEIVSGSSGYIKKRDPEKPETDPTLLFGSIPSSPVRTAEASWPLTSSGNVGNGQGRTSNDAIEPGADSGSWAYDEAGFTPEPGESDDD